MVIKEESELVNGPFPRCYVLSVFAQVHTQIHCPPRMRAMMSVRLWSFIHTSPSLYHWMFYSVIVISLSFTCTALFLKPKPRISIFIIIRFFKSNTLFDWILVHQLIPFQRMWDMTYIMEFLVHPERRSDQGNIIRMFPMWNSC